MPVPVSPANMPRHRAVPRHCDPLIVLTRRRGSVRKSLASSLLQDEDDRGQLETGTSTPIRLRTTYAVSRNHGDTVLVPVNWCVPLFLVGRKLIVSGVVSTKRCRSGVRVTCLAPHACLPMFVLRPMPSAMLNMRSAYNPNTILIHDRQIQE